MIKTGYGGWWLTHSVYLPPGVTLTLPKVPLPRDDIELCWVTHPCGHWHCDRAEGHGLRHAATLANGVLVAVWSDDDGRGHSHAIAALRREAEAERDGVHPDEHRQHRLDAAAALLECHDATGINLATFGPVGDFVNDMLDDLGYAPFTDNGV